MTNNQSYQSTGKLLLRVILSPFIFLYGCILLIAFTFYPLPLLVLYSIIGIAFNPFIWLLRVSGVEIESISPFFNYPNRSKMFGHFIGLTVYIWSPFFMAYWYIKYAVIYNANIPHCKHFRQQYYSPSTYFSRFYFIIATNFKLISSAATTQSSANWQQFNSPEDGET